MVTSTATMRDAERRLHHVRLLADLWRVLSTADAIDLDLRGALRTLFVEAIDRAGTSASAGADLVSSLRSLAGVLGGRAEVGVEQHGDTVALPPATAEALVRTVLGWLLGAGLDGRASVVAILVEHEPGQVVVRMRDDGAGVVHRTAFGLPWGIRALQRAAEAAGGSLRVRNLTARRGVEAVVVLPVVGR